MARKGSSNHPGSAGLAQSGGRNTTFGTSKGGTPLSRGVTGSRSVGKGMLSNSTPYSIRNQGGDLTESKVPHKRAGAPPPVHAGESGMQTRIRKPKQLPPTLRGSQGSTSKKVKRAF